MNDDEHCALLLAVTIILALLICLYAGVGRARDLGQWEDTDPEIRHWYQHLMMPDSPGTSCCGVADAYWADSFETSNGQFYAIITDDRPDVPLQRRHIDIGTRIPVPDRKLVDSTKQQNPTGHGIVFVGPGPMNNNVYCYVMPGGV